MLRELAVFLFASGIVSAGEPPRGFGAIEQSLYSISTPAPQLNVAGALPSYDIPLEAKILRAQQAFKIHAPKKYVASLSEKTSGNLVNAPTTYSIQPAVVNTIASGVPAPEKEVTIEAHQHIIAHPPTAATVIKQTPTVAIAPVPQRVQTVVNRPAVQYVRVQRPSQIAVNTFQETVTAYPPSAAYVTSTPAPQLVPKVQTVAYRPGVEYISAPVIRGVQPGLIKTVPTGENKVTIEAHQSVTAHPPSVQYEKSAPIAVQPVQQYAKNINERPAIQYVLVPVVAAQRSFQDNSQAIQSYESVNAFPPSAEYVTSTVAPQPVPYVKHVVNPDSVQFVSPAVNHFKPVLVKSVAPAKTVTIESHQSVTAHPPTPVVAPVKQVQIVTTPAPVQYVPISKPLSKPNPAPVIYSTYSAEEAPSSQYVSVSKQIESAPVVVTRPPPVIVRRPIPVPVLYPQNQGYVEYNNQRVSTPVVYTKSIVEKDHVSADLVATQVTDDGGYAKALVYSPASAVSSVNFNGLGVSYNF